MNDAASSVLGVHSDPIDANRFGDLIFSRPRRPWLLTFLAMVVDFLSFWLSFSCALLITIMLRDFLERPGYLFYIDPESSALHASVFAILIAALMLWMAYRGHYQRRIPFWMEMRQISAACIAGLLLDGFFLYSLKEPFSRLWVFSAWLLAMPALCVARWMLRRVLDHIGLWSFTTAIFGTPEATARVKQVFEREHYLGYDVQAEVTMAPCPVASIARDADKPVRVEFAVICFGDGDVEECEKLVTGLARAGTPFAVIPPIRGLMVSGLEIHYFFNDDLIMMVENNYLMSPISKAIKRGFDLTVASILLILGLPALVLIALWIKSDGGPIFFGHSRIGRRGRTFLCWKFRTMVVDADARLAALLESDPAARAEWEKDFKLRDDPRITPFGRFLRQTAIDELPQLLNVVKGDMSLVGPRPIVEAEAERYGADIDSYLQLRPGMTGLWQVSGRNDVSYDQRIEMDRWYIRNWSIWHDIAIIFKTVPALLLRRGAY